MTVFFDFIKKNALFLLFVSALSGFSLAVNYLIPWDYLTIFFNILQNAVGLFSWIIPLDIFYHLIYLSLSVQLSLWTYKGVMLIVNWYNKR